jgi:hypothetical protein
VPEGYNEDTGELYTANRPQILPTEPRRGVCVGGFHAFRSGSRMCQGFLKSLHGI